MDHVTFAKLKTAFLFNIAKFATWPDAGQEIRICVHAETTMTNLVHQLNGRDIGMNQQRIVVSDDLQPGGCHIIFVEYGDSHTSGQALNRAIKSYDVLLISDRPDALESGYTMQFFVVDGKLRFAVNKNRLKDAKYKLSSKLMKLARERR